MSDRRFRLLGALAVAVRLALILTTYGTNDVGFMAASAALVERVGIAHGYSHTAMMNHPPLGFAYMEAIDRTAAALGIAFTDLFRLFQVIADVVTAVALYRIGLRSGGVASAQRLALFVLLSPASAFISAFHCNTDATMNALVMAAAALLFANRDAAGGGILAAASGIKIPPLLLVPIFGATARSRMRFAAGFGLVAAAIFLPPIVIGGPIVIRVVFGYRGGLPYEWGIPGVAFAVSNLYRPARAVMTWWQTYGSWFEYAAIAAVIVLAWRKRPLTPPAMLHASAIMFMTVLALATGFGVQYIGWLVPLLPFALSWRGALLMNGLISLFLFITYTVWSGGLPWWFADIARPGPHRYVAALAGCAMWIAVCAALAVSLVRFRRMTPQETAG